MDKEYRDLGIEIILRKDNMAAIKRLEELQAEARENAVVILKSMDEDSSGGQDEWLSRYNPLLSDTQLTKWPESKEWVETLKAEFPWMESIIDKIERQSAMSIRMGYRPFKIHPILLVGKPGIGKTHFLRRLSEVLSAPTVFLELAGSSDNLTLKGISRNFTHSRPGILLDTMLEHKTANPLVILDEIDKVSESQIHGRIWETVLSMIEPSSSQKILDECLRGEVDYSHVNWLATANEISNLPAPLRSRFSVIKVDTPKEKDYDVVFRNIIKTIAVKYKTSEEFIPAIDASINNKLRERFKKNHLSLRNMVKVINELIEIEISAEESKIRQLKKQRRLH